MAYMRDDADNRLPRLIVTIAKALPQGFLVGPILVGKILVDDRYGLASAAVLIGEEAAADEPNAHRFEIARADAANVAVRPGIAWRRDTTFNVERCGTSKTTEWQWHARSRGDHARGTGKALQSAVEKCNLLLWSIVLPSWQRERCARQTLGTKSKVD